MNLLPIKLELENYNVLVSLTTDSKQTENINILDG